MGQKQSLKRQALLLKASTSPANNTSQSPNMSATARLGPTNAGLHDIDDIHASSRGYPPATITINILHIMSSLSAINFSRIFSRRCLRPLFRPIRHGRGLHLSSFTRVHAITVHIQWSEHHFFRISIPTRRGRRGSHWPPHSPPPLAAPTRPKPTRKILGTPTPVPDAQRSP